MTRIYSMLIVLSLCAAAVLLEGCATAKRRPASTEASEMDKIQYEKYVRKVERQDFRFSDRLEQ